MMRNFDLLYHNWIKETCKIKNRIHL
jgi:hypothetical protein